MSECVNHPDHYKTGKYECIEAMKEIFGVDAVKDFCKMNAFKYLWRADRKNGDEDLKKAKWYLDTYLLSELLNSEDPYEPYDPDDEDDEDEDEDESNGLSGFFKLFHDAVENVAAIMAEVNDPETEMHKRFEIFKDIKARGCSEELAFFHAFKDEVTNEQHDAED